MGDDRENHIKSLAIEAGFSLAGIASLEPRPQADSMYQSWLDAGKHGDMSYLVRHREKRSSPSLLLEGARSAICVALNYHQDPEKTAGRSAGVFSLYARGQDYHGVVEEMLARLTRRLKTYFPKMKSIACVDTKPVSDRTMALASGIAWLGKNTNVICPEFGSWIFLGEIISDLELDEDRPLETMCGDCTRCVDACPTGALEPFALDARKCISYLTVEKRGPVPAELHESIGLNLFGCDACQLVCPFNESAKNSAVFDHKKRSPLLDMTVKELTVISDGVFREKTVNSAVRRCGGEGMRRNALIVDANLTRRPTAR